MIRLRVTDLDAWAGYVQPVREEFEVSTEELITHLRRQAPETEAMRAGAAFHSMLETAQPGQELDDDCAGVQSGAFRFYCGPDLEVAVAAVREELVERTYLTPAGPVLLRGRVDTRDGLEVTDYKLTLGAFDAERYAGSLQWRAYLDMTGGRRFRYLVFSAAAKDSRVWIHEAHELVLWAYPEMGGEVGRRVAELAAFVRTHVPELVTDDAVRRAAGVR